MTAKFLKKHRPQKAYFKTLKKTLKKLYNVNEKKNEEGGEKAVMQERQKSDRKKKVEMAGKRNGSHLAARSCAPGINRMRFWWRWPLRVLMATSASRCGCFSASRHWAVSESNCCTSRSEHVWHKSNRAMPAAVLTWTFCRPRSTTNDIARSTHVHGKNCIAEKSIPELQSVTCHKESHSVTCCPTQVNAPRLNPSQTGQEAYSIYLPWRDGRLSCHWCW